MYQNVFLFPNKLHPTSFQYRCALAVLATASRDTGPMRGQPVSVTQTGLPAATPSVCATAELKLEAARSMELGLVSVIPR